jgi:hypothetical protein
VAFDGHRSNNDAPHIFMTEDFGMTWTSLVANLPAGSTRCLREDVTNENLLYCGTEFGVFASVDRGGHWIHVKNNLPTVAVHEIAVHPTAGEIVAGTHGRSAWILEVTPLRQFTQKVAEAKAHLFQPREGVLWAGALGFSRSGHRNFAGTNPAFGSRIFYYLGADAMNVLLEIRDVRGRAIRRLPVKKSKGLHAARWDLRAAAGRPAARPTPPDGKTAGPTNRKAPTLNRPGASAPPGTYIISLKVDGKEFVQEIKITSDPDFPTAMLQEELEIETAKQRQEVIE